MKIAYINGYGGHDSNKHLLIEKLGYRCDHIIYDKNYKTNFEKIKEYDLIIASSTGAYVAREYCHKFNTPLISLNPVIDIKEVFKKLGDTPPDVELCTERLIEMVLISKDDELLDINKTIDFCTDYNIWYVLLEGTHRFNIPDMKDPLKKFINLNLIGMK